MKTYIQWFIHQFNGKLPDLDGRLLEDGYAWYLQQQLGRTPTISEVKTIGKIYRLTTEPIVL